MAVSIGIILVSGLLRMVRCTWGPFCCGLNLTGPRGAAYAKTLRGAWCQAICCVMILVGISFIQQKWRDDARLQKGMGTTLYPTKWRDDAPLQKEMGTVQLSSFL
jgi:hypothetical protein